MDLSTFPPIAAVLDTLYNSVFAVSHFLTPLAGSSSTAVAIIALTIAIRLVLVPVSVTQVRAEIGRRRLAPAMAALRAKYAGRPEQLQKALTRLYTDEKVSPLAGCLPTLAQAPVLSAFYALFAHANLAGHANLLLSQTFAGIPLGSNLLMILGASLSHTWVIVLVLILLTVVIELTRRANARWAAHAQAGADPTSVSAVSRATSAVASPALSPAISGVMRVLPFLSVAFAAIAPLAATLYLVTSATFALGERAALRRILSRR